MRGIISKAPARAAVAAGCLALAGCSSDGGAAQGGSRSGDEAAPSASSAPAESAKVEPSVCGLDEGDPELPADRPADLEVGTWRHVSLPTSETHGPGKETATERSCFSHDPEGAALAAINLAAQMASVEDLERVVSSGQQRDQLAENWGTTISGASVEGTPVGYRVDSFEGERAQVTWALRQGQRILLAPYVLVWVDGDWRLDGETPSADRPESEWVESLDDAEGVVVLDAGQD